ncbi:MAG: cardiolipin synthase [Methanomassiliicoccales archaeon]|nr:cardiolipin synthase [Methanomassiliicoccales archaeon]
MTVSEFLQLFLYLNAILIVITIVFVRPRRVQSIYLWIAAFLLLPILFVVVFYLFFGRDYRRAKLFKSKGAADKLGTDYLRKVREELFVCSDEHEVLCRHASIAKLLLDSNQALVTVNNRVDYFNQGDRLFESVFNEIKNAKRYIHMEYYLFRDDELGRRLVRELASKAKQGVEVKLLYDAFGGHSLPRGFFKEITESGGKTAVFFPSLLRRFNTRINNRNHRKLLAIDGETCFCGGFNIGMEYLGKGPLGDWRDAAVLVKGAGCIGMEYRFIQDWNFAAEDSLQIEDYCLQMSPEYLSGKDGPGHSAVQVVSSGPDTEFGPIEQEYLKMISGAKRSVRIQTPYFVPDEPVLSALRVAALSGVDVQIMIPFRPDHPFVYWATLYYVGTLLKSGVKVYQFSPGFVHAKTLVIDGEVASVGSANFDVRSFELNFETNAVIYDEALASEMMRAFQEDVQSHCLELTPDHYAKRSDWTKFMESISRLYTPIA